jgi:hypothetical protein
MRGKSAALLAMALALAVALATVACHGGGSGSGPATDGPLNDPSGTPGRSTVCASARVGRPFAFGLDTFTNHGHATVVLDRVALQRPYHERLIGSYAVPGVYIVGAVPWPPINPPTSRNWKHRQAVHGFRLAPRKTFNLVIGVIATSSGRATSQGMRIYYHDTTGNSYLALDPDRLFIVTANQRCN